MSDIAVIGDRDSVLGFKALGVSTYFWNEETASNSEEWKNAIDEVVDKDYKIIFITEEYHKKCRERIEELYYRVFPVFIAIPNNKGTQKYGFEIVRRLVARAIGTDIFAQDEELK
jgi:V/A-type H+-transporting ATPase subunit F